MPKIQKGTIEVKNEMSIEMLKDCKNEIAKFGFTGKEYVQFLISVQAMKNENTVFKFPNHEIEKYRDKYLKKYEHTVEDSMQLDKFKIKSVDENGFPKETGYFTPRSFWDKILETKI